MVEHFQRTLVLSARGRPHGHRHLSWPSDIEKQQSLGSNSPELLLVPLGGARERPELSMFRWA